MQKDVYFIEPEVSTETFPIHIGNTKYEFLLCIYGSHNAFTLALYRNLLKQEHTKSFFFNIYFRKYLVVSCVSWKKFSLCINDCMTLHYWSTML